jgi:tetratricopeptide (TPR) repeat protein
MRCAHDARVAQLLSEAHSDQEEEWLESHLETCPVCQAQLDSALADLHRRSAAVADAGSQDVSLSQRLHQRLDGALRNFYAGGGSMPCPDPTLGPARTNESIGSLGPYDLIRELGRGGFGIVYLAFDPQVNRRFAIKLPRTDLANDPGYVSRFYEEAKKSNEVNSPYVVPVVRVGSPPEFQHPCLVMEYIEGQTLREISKAQTSEQRRTGFRQTAAIVRQVAEGLHALHAKGLLHRDVKSANILLDEHTGVPKLSDFGLAWNLTGGDQFQEETAGTFSYMSPEVIRWGKPDQRSDQYSLGIVLYECLVGERPFRADTADALKRQILDDAPAPPRSRNGAIPRDLETITLKCLAKEADQRYRTVKDLADDLGRFLAGEPIQAKPVSRLRRAWLWCRRNPWLAIVLVLLAAIVTGLLAASYQANCLLQETERQRNLASQSYRKQVDTLKFIADRLIEELPLEPGTQEIRSRLERDFLNHFRDLVEGTQDTTSVYFADACATYARYAYVFGQLPEARSYYERAVGVYEGLTGTEREESLENHAKFRVNLATVYHDLRLRQEAFAQFDRALALVRTIPQDPSQAGEPRLLGEFLLQRGTLKNRDGQCAEAIRDYQQAERCFLTLLKRSPDDALLLGALAGVKQNEGNALDPPGTAAVSDEARLKARQCYVDALAYLRRITGPAAQTREYLNHFAECSNGLAVSEKRLSHMDKAFQAYDESVRIRRDLVSRYPADLKAREGLARTLSNLANLYAETNELEKARSLFAEAIEQRENLLKVRPDEPNYGYSLVNTYLLASKMERTAGQLDRARGMADNAVRVASKAVARAPVHAESYRILTEALRDRAQVLLEIGDDEGAVASYREALVYQGRLVNLPERTVADRWNVAALHHALADPLCALRRPQEAVTDLENAAAIWQKIGDATADLRAAECLARCVALSGDGTDSDRLQHWTQQAIAALRRAVQAGFNDIETLKNGAQFEAIRHHEGYQQLLRESQTPTVRKTD